MKQTLTLVNNCLQLTLDANSGAILQLTDRKANFSYIDENVACIPFRLLSMQGDVVCQQATVQAEAHKDTIDLCWHISHGEVRAKITLQSDGVGFRAQWISDDAQGAPCLLEYPVLSNLVDRGAQTYLAHSWATGVLMQNPASFLPETGALRYAPYPESFSGCSMQMMTLYFQGISGLYLAAEDGKAHQKWLNAYTENGRLCLSHMVGMEDMHSGAGIQMDYDFVLRFTRGGGWEDAALLYRQFAEKQRWCARGKLSERCNDTDWLHEDTGYCTFGINAGYDRSKWLKKYREDIGTHGFHVLGPDWTNVPQTFGEGVPGGMEDWLPTRFDKQTLQAIDENGDRFAPFEFDFLFDPHQHQAEELEAARQQFPKPTFSHDLYDFHMLCPCEPFTKDFHRERDLQVVQQSGADAMYYDISANNLLKVCMRTDHHHCPGGGMEITEGYREIYRDTADALEKSEGKPILLGTEQMNEVFLDELNYYQARAWGQPCSTLETWPIRAQMLSGQAKMIPLFDMVYHDYGVVRMDGWGKLTQKIGRLFFDTVAKTYLWGGLYEINHEYSPMEEIEGEENDGAEHYYHFDPRHAAYSSACAAWVGAFAKARIGCAKPWWVYGQMLPCPALGGGEEELDWFHYNHGQLDPSYEAGGSYSCPRVRSGCFKAPNGCIGLFMAIPGEADLKISLPLEELAERYAGRSATLYRIVDGQAELMKDLSMTDCDGKVENQVELQSRSIYMLEIKIV